MSKIKTKICSKCGKKKPFSEFNKGNDENRLHYWCRVCLKRYHAGRSSKVSVQRKHYRRDNAVMLAKYEKQYSKSHALQISKRKKKHNSSFALYENFFMRLKMFEFLRLCPENPELLEVRCVYCGQWVLPTVAQVKARLQVFNGTLTGEHRFYCSENCKQSCPTYNQNKYPKGFKQATSREVVPLLRQLVLKRDNYTCQKCGATTETAQLHVHHIIPYAQNKMQANDPDSCITFCKECHKKTHQQDGCRYVDLKC